MKIVFRWYGTTDKVPLEYIRQIPGVSGVVSAIYEVPVGEIWSLEEILALKQMIQAQSLELEIIESVPVHEDIKLGLASRERYIENYKQNIRNLAQAGIKVICYNFMPVFDWIRSSLDKKLSDGSTALVYEKDVISKMDPRTGDLQLPGWDVSYGEAGLGRVLDQYQEITAENLWDNLAYFLQQIIPVAEEVGIKMAIHADDPPWLIFGLPRIISDRDALDRLVKIIDSPSNGITLCSGSLGVAKNNDIPELAREFGARGKIHFVHLRNVKITESGSFEESAHLSSCGSLDMVAILQALYEVGFAGYVRPDHGRMIWGETGKPGYGLYDRALGVSYINGIWETLEKLSKQM